MSYRIGSFNLKNLGLSAMSNKNPRELSLIAEIIREENLDIVALQEVLSEGKAINRADYTKKTLLMELGYGWDFVWALAGEGLNDIRNEGYAFIWNKNKFQLPTVTLSNGNERTFYPRIYKARNDNLFRRPYYGRFIVKDGPDVELRLLCIHAYYGSATGFDDKIKRQEEIDTILRDIYPEINDRQYKENKRARYTVVLGDYNLELKAPGNSGPYINELPFADVKTEGREKNYVVRTFQPHKTTLKKPKEGTESDIDGYSKNFDHFSYEINSVFRDIGHTVDRIDAVEKYTDGSFDDYYCKVSDHVPIVLEIDLKNGK